MEILKLFVKKLIPLIIFLLFIATNLNCSSSWSTFNYKLTSDSIDTNTIFIEIISHDSTEHWYLKNIYNGSNWCYLHSGWEDVRIR